METKSGNLKEMKCIDISRYRRMQFEKHHSEHELLFIDFDVFGHPRRLEVAQRVKHDDAVDARPLRERIGDEAADMLMLNQPELARRLGLFDDVMLVDVKNEKV